MRQLVARSAAGGFDLWFYTPLALPLAEGLAPGIVVYDCMDELSGFKNAPPQLLAREAELLRRADVVFTGGTSLYRAKRTRNPNTYCFPSSVDAAHFGTAAGPLAEPFEQAAIPHPRLGFFGVIDERFDLDLLARAPVPDPVGSSCWSGRWSRSTRPHSRMPRTSTTSASECTPTCRRF